MPVSIQSIEKEYAPSPWSKNKLSFYGSCLLLKELILAYISTPFWLDYEKVKDCNVYCDQCEYKMNIAESIGHFASYARSDIVAKLKRLLYKANVDQINQYLLKINMQEEQECVKCRDFCGWHLKMDKYKNP